MATPASLLSEVLKTKVTELGLRTRLSNSLVNTGIKTLEDLVTKTEMDLMRIPGVSRHSIEDVKHALSKMGLRLGSNMLDTPMDELYVVCTEGDQPLYFISGISAGTASWSRALTTKIEAIKLYEWLRKEGRTDHQIRRVILGDPLSLDEMNLLRAQQLISEKGLTPSDLELLEAANLLRKTS